MAIPVQLYRKFIFSTVEVDDKSSDGVLSSKLEPAQLVQAQMLPEHNFGWC